MFLILRLTSFLAISLLFVKDIYSFGFFTCTESSAKKMTFSKLTTSQKKDLNKCFKEFSKHPKFFTALMEKEENKLFCSKLLKFKDKKKKQPIQYLKLPKSAKAKVKSKSELYQICYASFMAASHHKHVRKTKLYNEQKELNERASAAEEVSRLDFKKSKQSDSEDLAEGEEEGEGEGEGGEELAGEEDGGDDTEGGDF
jgi:hypothetical protein